MDIQTASGTKKASRDVAIWQPVACKLVSFFPPVYTGESSRDQQQAVSIACRVHDDFAPGETKPPAPLLQTPCLLDTEHLETLRLPGFPTGWLNLGHPQQTSLISGTCCRMLSSLVFHVSCAAPLMRISVTEWQLSPRLHMPRTRITDPSDLVKRLRAVSQVLPGPSCFGVQAFVCRFLAVNLGVIKPMVRVWGHYHRTPGPCSTAVEFPFENMAQLRPLCR